MHQAPVSQRVAILLSTRNGERFLQEQLDSIVAQDHTNWVLYWRDDGSTDGTVALMRAFMAGAGAGRCIAPRLPGRIGATRGFIALLKAAMADCPDAVAFADQDDIWLRGKLRLGLAALSRETGQDPALYCARQILVDADLGRLGLSCRLRRPPGFLAALTQNIATGCTVMLNRAAGDLVRRSQPPPGTLHDWWSYLLVAGAGGRLIVDDSPVILYRQHPGNAVGAPHSMPRRAVAAFRRGPCAFMSIMRQHVEALSDQSDLLSEEGRRQLRVVSSALAGGPLRRVAILPLPGFHRQTWPEMVVFWLWFVSGAGSHTKELPDDRFRTITGRTPRAAGAVRE